MTAFIVAATIRRYVTEMARTGCCEVRTKEWGDVASAAIAAQKDCCHTDLIRLLEYLASACPADIGLRCGNARRLSEFGIVGHAIASSRTLGEALRIAIDQHAGSDALRDVHFQMQGGDWLIDICPHMALSTDVRRLLSEEWVASFFAFFTEVTGLALPAARIEFGHLPGADSDYERWLPAPPVFGKKRSRLILPARLLDQPLVSHDGDMLHLIRQHLAAPLGNKNSVADQVRRYLVQNDGKPPRLATAALKIGMSSRTLVRRLHEEGTTYSQILDCHRHSQALAFASNGQWGAKQISAAMGYCSVQSFQRSFLEWTGMSFSRWRRENDVK